MGFYLAHLGTFCSCISQVLNKSSKLQKLQCFVVGNDDDGGLLSRKIYCRNSTGMKAYQHTNTKKVPTCNLINFVQDSWGEQLICKQSYGATETTGIATISAWEDDILSVGKLLPGFQVKVWPYEKVKSLSVKTTIRRTININYLLQIIGLDDGRILGPGKKGELFIKSPSIMKGYLGNEEATKQVLFDGWYRSGDVAYYNEKGLIYIKGRKKDFIQCNGVLVRLKKFTAPPKEIKLTLNKSFSFLG